MKIMEHRNKKQQVVVRSSAKTKLRKMIFGLYEYF